MLGRSGKLKKWWSFVSGDSGIWWHLEVDLYTIVYLDPPGAFWRQFNTMY